MEILVSHQMESRSEVTIRTRLPFSSHAIKDIHCTGPRNEPVKTQGSGQVHSQHARVGLIYFLEPNQIRCQTTITRTKVLLWYSEFHWFGRARHVSSPMYYLTLVEGLLTIFKRCHQPFPPQFFSIFILLEWDLSSFLQMAISSPVILSGATLYIKLLLTHFMQLH